MQKVGGFRVFLTLIKVVPSFLGATDLLYLSDATHWQGDTKKVT